MTILEATLLYKFVSAMKMLSALIALRLLTLRCHVLLPPQRFRDRAKKSIDSVMRVPFAQIQERDLRAV